MRQLAQLTQSVLHVGPQLFEHLLGRARIGLEQPAGQAELDRHGHQVLLGAVVQVALDLAPRVVRRGDDAGPRRPQLPVPVAQLVE